MSDEKPNTSTNANVSLKRRTLKIIDEHRVDNGRYKTRSDYIQDLVNRDLDFSRFEYISDLMSMNVLPLMGFLMFLFIFILTAGPIFLLMGMIFGIFAIWLTIMYVKKYGKRSKRRR